MQSAFRDSVVVIVGWKWLRISTHFPPFFKNNFSMRLKVALPHFPRRSSLCVAFSQAPLMTSEHDKWSWCDAMSGKPKWLWGSELPKPTQHTRHSNLRLRRWREREKEESKAVSFQVWYETLNRIYLSLLVQVPSEPWIFCKTLLTTTGHRSELNSAARDLGLRKLLKPWNIHAAEHLLSSWCACRLVWCRQVTPAAGWLTDVGRDSPWVRSMGFKC